MDGLFYLLEGKDESIILYGSNSTLTIKLPRAYDEISVPLEGTWYFNDTDRVLPESGDKVPIETILMYLISELQHEYENGVLKIFDIALDYSANRLIYTIEVTE